MINTLKKSLRSSTTSTGSTGTTKTVVQYEKFVRFAHESQIEYIEPATKHPYKPKDLYLNKKELVKHMRNEIVLAIHTEEIDPKLASLYFCHNNNGPDCQERKRNVKEFMSLQSQPLEHCQWADRQETLALFMAAQTKTNRKRAQKRGAKDAAEANKIYKKDATRNPYKDPVPEN